MTQNSDIVTPATIVNCLESSVSRLATTDTAEMTRHNSQSVREKRDPSVYFTFRQNGDFITLQLPTHVYLFTMSDNKYSLQFQNLEWLAPHAQVLRLFPSLL